MLNHKIHMNLHDIHIANKNISINGCVISNEFQNNFTKKN